MVFSAVEGSLQIQGTVSGTDITPVALHGPSHAIRVFIENPSVTNIISNPEPNALVGQDGIAIVSGTSTTNILGFRPEFVSASGSLQSQITSTANAVANLDTTYATDVNVAAISGHLQGLIDTANADVTSINGLQGPVTVVGDSFIGIGVVGSSINLSADAIVGTSNQIVVSSGNNMVTIALASAVSGLTSIQATTITGSAAQFAGALSAQAGAFSHSLTVSGIPVAPGDRHPPFANVRDYGATGNGATNDTAAINSAIAAAANSSKVLYFPAGNYVHSGLIITTSGLRVDLSNGATLFLADGSNTNSIQIATSDVTVAGGGTIDGNRENQSDPGEGFGNGIWVNDQTTGTLRNNVVRDIQITRTMRRGVFVLNALQSTVEKVKTSRTRHEGILIRKTGAGLMTGTKIVENTVDRSDHTLRDNNSKGILVVADSGDGEIEDALIQSNSVYFHPLATGIGSQLCIEIYADSQPGAIRDLRIVNNTTYDGDFGISVAAGTQYTSVGNNHVHSAAQVGIEVADSQYNTVDGNTVFGKNKTITGIVIDGTNITASGNVASSNVVRNTAGQALYVINAAPGCALNNNIVIANAGYGVRLLTSSGIGLSGNIVDCGNTGNPPLLIHNTSHVSIAGGSYTGGISQAAQILASNNYSLVDVTFTPSTILAGPSGPITLIEQSGGSIARVNKSYFPVRNKEGTGNPGGVAGFFPVQYQITGGVESNTVLQGIMSNSPESAIDAELGSVVQRYGAAAPTELLYVKTTVTGTTGWKPIQPVNSFTTAGRPAVNAGDIGYELFDTTIDKPVWWNGSSYTEGGNFSTVSGILQLKDQNTVSSLSVGLLAFSGTNLKFYDGTAWRTVNLT